MLRRLATAWLLHAPVNRGHGTVLGFFGCYHLHGSSHVTMIFVLIVSIVAHTRHMWSKCGFWRKMFFNECILLLKSWLCETSSCFTPRSSFLPRFMGLSLTFPCFQYHKYVPKANSGGGGGWRSCMSSASLQICLQMHVQIHPAFPCHRALFTFLYILPPRFHPS